MVSSKGKPTDPKLREEAKDGTLICLNTYLKLWCHISCGANAHLSVDVKQMTNKDGSGKGQMAAWKVSLCLEALFCAAASRITSPPFLLNTASLEPR